MRSAEKILFNIVKLTALFLLPLCSLHAADVIEAWQEVRADQYIETAHDDLEESKKLFTQLLNGDFSQDLQTALNEMNFRVVRYENNTGSFLMIREDAPPYRGSGMYLVRLNGNGDMLQAPHAFKDLHTGKLAIKLMLEGKYSALAINTVPRRYSYKGQKKESDMAHMYDTFFISFSHAFAHRYPDGQIVQLHGFNGDSRAVTNNTSMIISAGVKASNSEVQRQVRCLRQKVTSGVKAYPDEINILGGTTNSIGRQLRAQGYSGFRHYEMNLSIRQALLDQKNLREKLTECIVNVN